MSEIEVITKSRLADFSLCQRLHDLKYNRGYRSLLPRELADFGTVFHAGARPVVGRLPARPAASPWPSESSEGRSL